MNKSSKTILFMPMDVYNRSEQDRRFVYKLTLAPLECFAWKHILIRLFEMFIFSRIRTIKSWLYLLKKYVASLKKCQNKWKKNNQFWIYEKLNLFKKILSLIFHLLHVTLPVLMPSLGLFISFIHFLSLYNQYAVLIVFRQILILHTLLSLKKN